MNKLAVGLDVSLRSLFKDFDRDRRRPGGGAVRLPGQAEPVRAAHVWRVIRAMFEEGPPRAPWADGEANPARRPRGGSRRTPFRRAPRRCGAPVPARARGRRSSRRAGRGERRGLRRSDSPGPVSSTAKRTTPSVRPPGGGSRRHRAPGRSRADWRARAAAGSGLPPATPGRARPRAARRGSAARSSARAPRSPASSGTRAIAVKSSRAEASSSPTSASISSTSCSSWSSTEASPPRPSSSRRRMRASGVRSSWLTAASSSRWSFSWRSMRSAIPFMTSASERTSPRA